MSIHEKIKITELIITEQYCRQKRFIQDRGELALIEDGLQIQHLGYFSLYAGKGYRGGHYHNLKTEYFYVISGRLLVDLIDVETKEKGQAELKAGNKAIISPGLAHRFQAIEDAQVIEYYAGVYDHMDDIRFEFETRVD